VKERSGGAGRPSEPTPLQAGKPEKTQTPQQRGEGIRGVPPPGEAAKPQQEGPEEQDLEKFRKALKKLGSKAKPPEGFFEKLREEVRRRYPVREELEEKIRQRFPKKNSETKR
jgi:hypothetical protein